VIAASVVAAIAGTALLATRCGGESVTTRGVTATENVPVGHPGALAVGEGALWFGLADPKRPVRKQPMYRLELATDSLTRSVDLGGQASYLLHAGDTLYAAVEHEGGDGTGPSRLDAFDWRTGDLKFSRPYPGLLGPLVRDGRTLWALQTQPGALIRVDASTLLPTRSPLSLPPGRSLGLALGTRYVWVTATDAGEVLRVDRKTAEVTRLRVGGAPIGIAVVRGHVWVADRERGTVMRIDPQTLRTIGEPAHVGAAPSALVAAGPYLLVGRGGSGSVTRIDTRSGRKAGMPIRFARPAQDAAFALAPGGTSIWASSFASNTLTRIDANGRGAPVPAATVSKALLQIPGQGPFPRAARIAATIRVPPLPPGNGGLATGEGAVWILNPSIGRLLRVDPETNSVVTQLRVAAYGDLAVGDGSIWLSNPTANTVDRLNPANAKVIATIPVGKNPLGVAVTPHAVWVANDGAAAPDIPSISRIDPRTNKVVATIALAPTSACCALHMGVTTADGAIWTVVPQANTLIRVDAASNHTAVFHLDYPPCAYLAAGERTVWMTGGACADVVGRMDVRTREVTKLVEPHPIGLRIAFGRVWVVSLAAGNLDQIDSATNQIVARLPIGGHPIHLAVGFGSLWQLDGDGRVLRIKPTR
jgi:YVTN family beta-propeller protein